MLAWYYFKVTPYDELKFVNIFNSMALWNTWIWLDNCSIQGFDISKYLLLSMETL